jgi:hypothetical protein
MSDTADMSDTPVRISTQRLRELEAAERALREVDAVARAARGSAAGLAYERVLHITGPALAAVDRPPTGTPDTGDDICEVCGVDLDEHTHDEAMYCGHQLAAQNAHSVKSEGDR